MDGHLPPSSSSKDPFQPEIRFNAQPTLGRSARLTQSPEEAPTWEQVLMRSLDPHTASCPLFTSSSATLSCFENKWNETSLGGTRPKN